MAAATLASCLLVVGCAASLQAPDDDPVLAALAGSAPDVPPGMSLAVGPIEGPRPPGDDARPLPRERHRVSGTEVATYGEDLVSCLTAWPVLGEGVLFIEAGAAAAGEDDETSGEDGATGGDGDATGDEAEDREAVAAIVDRVAAREAAAQAGADVILFPRITRHEVRHIGRGGWWGTNLVLWSILFFPSWFVPDHLFGAEVDLALEAVAVESGRRVWSGRAIVGTEDALSTVSRDGGFFNYLVGIAAVPGLLGPAAWETIAVELRPGTRRRVRQGFVALVVHGLLASGALEDPGPPDDPDEGGEDG